MEIFDGIHQLKAPMRDGFLAYTLIYLIKGEEGYVLVDAGSSVPGAVEAVGEQLKEINVSFPEIKYIVVTHVHPDHFGLAGALRARSGATLVTHERTREHLLLRQSHPFGPMGEMDDWSLKHGLDPREEREYWGRPGEMDFHRGGPGPGMGFGPWQIEPMAEPDLTVKGGEALEFVHRRFEVIFTPGHSPDHICLYDRQRKVIFTGDHILPVITPHVSYQQDVEDHNPLGEYLEGIRTLRSIEADYTLPAHQFTIPNLQQRLDELEHHHAERNQFIFDALAEGEKSAYEVTSRVRWDVGSWESMHPGVRRSALNECMAHLEYLRHQGRVEMVERDNRYFYRLA